MNSSARYWLILLAVLAAAYGSIIVNKQREPAAAKIEAPQPPPPRSIDLQATSQLHLIDQTGKPFELVSLDGDVWLASFFFTNCPAICWRLNQALAELQNEAAAQDVRFVSFTCDPDNDTPAQLAKYAEHFKADPHAWVFLTGEMDTLRAVGHKMFRVAVEKGTHSSRVFVVDRHGKIRGHFEVTEPEQFARLKKLLARMRDEPAGSTAAGRSTSGPRFAVRDN